MPSVRLLAVALVLVTGCADIDTEVTTSPTAHESPPLPPPPLQRIAGGRFLGGSALDVIDDVAVGDDGNFYIVGGTASLDFPVTLGEPVDATAPADCPACPFDGFVASVAPDGALRWARLIQTPGYDRLRTIVARGNNLWVAGSAGDGDLAPIGFHGGADPERGEQDGVLCHLMAAGGQLTGCRYVGGDGPAGVADVAVSPDGSEVVLAMTTIAGEDLHLDPDYLAAFAGSHRATSTSDDVVVLGFTADLTLQWATYVGGSGAETGTPSVLRDDLFTFVLTETTSDDAPAPGALDGSRNGGVDAYLATFRDQGTTLHYATYLGGSADERVSHNSLVGDRSELYVGLDTSSNDLPAASAGEDTSFGGDGGPDCGSGDVWIAHLRPGSFTGAQSLLAASYLGGAQGEHLGGMSLVFTNGFDGDRLAVVAQTYSTNLPVRNGAQFAFASPACASGSPGRTDAYVAVYNSALFVSDATYLGGTGLDDGVAVAQSFAGTIGVVGNTESSALAIPTLHDTSYGGNRDGFLMAYDPDQIPPLPGDGGGNPFPDGGSGNNPDAGIPPGYDEGPSGCCGTSTPAGSTLGLALAALAILVARRRRS